MRNRNNLRIRDKIVKSSWYELMVPKEFRWAIENAQCYKMDVSTDADKTSLTRLYEVISGCYCFRIQETRNMTWGNGETNVTFSHQAQIAIKPKIRNNISF